MKLIACVSAPLTAVLLVSLTGCRGSSTPAAPSTAATTSAASDIILPSDAASVTAGPTAATPSSAAADTTTTSANSTAPTTTAAHSSGSKNPCLLVTGGDIAKVTGLSVGAPRTSEVGASTLCSYSHQDSDQDKEFAVLVTAVHDSENRADFELGRTTSGASAVTGLGSDAYWDDRMDTMYVLQGSFVFEVAIGGSNEAIDAAARSECSALARLALTRL